MSILLIFILHMLQLISNHPMDVDTAPPVAVVAPAPEHHAPVVPPVVRTPDDAPTQSLPTPEEPTVTEAPAPEVVVEEPTCQEGEEFQGEFGCVATQLPEETDGRQYD
jgi:hypothetical protein